MADPAEFGHTSGSPTDDRTSNDRAPDSVHDTLPDNASVPKPKRLACMICRRRKLKCDGLRPSCSTCSRLGHPCAYDEHRRKSGPKRGYVKALEERLKQVETLLKTQEPSQPAQPLTGLGIPTAANRSSMALDDHDPESDRFHYTAESPRGVSTDDFNFNSGIPMSMPLHTDGGNLSWEIIGLGVEEPLPSQEIIDELNQIYFEKVHPSIPMIHRHRHLAATNLAPNQQPPVCLRYAMWTMACSITDKYSDIKHLFYTRARKYVEADHGKGFGEHMISVAHCQTHALLACYEMKMMYFPRAWISTGSAVRLAQMIGLHRLDGTGSDAKQCLGPPKDWTELEERRRTFWMTFCEDRYASIGTGWPMSIDERDVLTHLPASDEAFDMSRQEPTQTLDEGTSPAGVAKLSSFSGIVLLAALFGRNLVHLHRPDNEKQDDDINGPFWKRHREMDNILLNTSLCLPSNLKLPAGLSNPSTVFLNMAIHTATICLHQAAIFKAETWKLPASLSSESKVRCITAANEIANVMRTVSHMDLSAMNPFISFTLYVAARVFVQYLKSRPEDDSAADSLRFLLSAMNALKKRNPLTESFLVQLDVDFEALLARIPKLKNTFPQDDKSPNQNAQGLPNVLSEDPENANVAPSYDYKDVGAGLPPSILDSCGLGLPDTAAFGAQAWLAMDNHMSSLHSASGSSYDKPRNGSGRHISSLGGDANGDGTTPSGGQSSDPTPNSSGGSDGRMPGQGKGVNGAMLGSVAGTATSPPTTLHAGSHPGFFNGSPPQASSHMSQQQQQQQQQQQGMQPLPFGVESGWDNSAAQQGSANTQNEGVLRALMNMGPMEVMDLTSWDVGDVSMRG